MIFDARDSSPSLTPHLFAVSKPATMLSITSAGLDTANRWGVKEGELSRASKIINSQFLNRITREYIDDQISVDEAVKKINAELAKF